MERLDTADVVTVVDPTAILVLVGVVLVGSIVLDKVPLAVVIPITLVVLIRIIGLVNPAVPIVVPVVPKFLDIIDVVPVESLNLFELVSIVF
jgi:hypothetical protein